MNILDIAQNSVHANASLIEISLTVDTAAEKESLCIKDNGFGMTPEKVQQVTDPFCTSRTSRKVGLGLPFLKLAAEMTGGTMHIESTVGVGTTVYADFGLNHIDLAPLGDMPGTISALVQTSPDIDFVYSYTYNGESFVFDTRQAREILGGVPLSEPEVVLFIRSHIAEGMQEAEKNT